MDANGNSDRHGLYGAALIGVGILLLLLQMFGDAGHYLWPFFIITPGVLLVLLGGAGGGQARYTAVAGTVLAGVGTILLFQVIFDHFESWAYAWTLLPFFAGSGLVFASHAEGDPEMAARGRNMMRWSAIAFAVLAVLFEVLIFNGGLFGGRFIAPVILIVVGGFLLFGRFGHRHDHRDDREADGQDGPTRSSPPA